MREHCWNCYRPHQSCLCSLMKSFSPPKMKVVILYHPLERKRPHGTGVLAHRILKNSELIVGVDFTHDQRVNQLISDYQGRSFVLYPGAESVLLNQEQGELNLLPQEEWVLFVLDGSWPCAKKMMKLSTNLQKLPRLSFKNEFQSQYMIRKQPHEACLSTIESLFQVLKIIDPLDERSKNLLEVFHTMIKWQVEAQLNPQNPSYRHRSELNTSLVRKAKKWETRSLFFSDRDRV